MSPDVLPIKLIGYEKGISHINNDRPLAGDFMLE